MKLFIVSVLRVGEVLHLCTECPLNVTSIHPSPTSTSSTHPISWYRVWLPQLWHGQSHRPPINTMRPRRHHRRRRPATDPPHCPPPPPTSRNSPQATAQDQRRGMDRPARRQSFTSTFTFMCHHQSRNISRPGEQEVFNSHAPDDQGRSEINSLNIYIKFCPPGNQFKCLRHRSTTRLCSSRPRRRPPPLPQSFLWFLRTRRRRWSTCWSRSPTSSPRLSFPLSHRRSPANLKCTSSSTRHRYGTRIRQASADDAIKWTC